MGGEAGPPLLIGCAGTADGCIKECAASYGQWNPLGQSVITGRMLLRVIAFAVLVSTAHAESGLDTAKLESWRAALAAHGTTGLVVMRRGAIAFEWYADGWNADRPHGTASMAKALVGGASLLVAMSDGRISPDDLASKYIPAWKNDPCKAKITIRHLATHTSGIEDAEQDNIAHEQLPGWKGAIWKRDPDPFSIAVRQAPCIFEPGTKYAYSNPGMAALSYAITASLNGGDVRTLLKSRVFDPLGLPEKSWSIGYGRAYDVDGLSLWANWGGASFTARAAAKVGEWMMLGGVWDGKQLVKREAVRLATTYAGMPKPDRSEDAFAPASGLAWYTNADGVWPDVPRDAIAGAGGLFDAPEPWGPWTEVPGVEQWGIAGTHGYRLPAKWIAADGLSLTMVFSGVRPNDAFCTRVLKLEKR
jgi:CubicO group peptidase (beta-lactamase class C family)